jgi:hypothetical protein
VGDPRPPETKEEEERKDKKDLKMRKSQISNRKSEILAPLVAVLAALLIGLAIMGVAKGEVNSEAWCLSYDGTGSQKTFTFNFGILATSQLRVVVRTVATGAEELLHLNSDYSMTDNDSDGDYTDGTPGGSITTLAADAYSSAYEIWIMRKPALTQARDIDGSTFVRVAMLEDAVDNLTYEVQYLRGLLYRVPMIPETEAQIADMNVPASPTRANRYAIWDVNGNPSTSSTTGAIDPVIETLADTTTYWQGRMTTDTNAAEALAGIGAQPADPNLDDLADGMLSKAKVEDSANWDAAYVAIGLLDPNAAAVDPNIAKLAALEPSVSSLFWWDVNDTNDSKWQPLPLGEIGEHLARSATAAEARTLLDVNGIAGYTVTDENDMASDSDSDLPTQQSVKAYVDASIPDVTLTQSSFPSARKAIVTFTGGLVVETFCFASTTDADQIVSFPEPFATACIGVQISHACQSVPVPSKSAMTVNRMNGIDGTVYMYVTAWGY